MLVSDIVSALDLFVVCGDTSREVNGCYVGDLLSWVMSRAQSDNVWITIMSNVNVPAVASLTDVACVILADDVELDDDAKKAASSKNICILKSRLPVFETAVAVNGVISGGD